MASSPLEEAGFSQLNANGNSSVQTTVPPNQTWVITEIFVTAQASIPPFPTCSIYRGSAIPSNLIATTIRGNNNTASGRAVFGPGEQITVTWSGGTPNDTTRFVLRGTAEAFNYPIVHGTLLFTDPQQAPTTQALGVGFVALRSQTVNDQSIFAGEPADIDCSQFTELGISFGPVLSGGGFTFATVTCIFVNGTNTGFSPSNIETGRRTIVCNAALTTFARIPVLGARCKFNVAASGGAGSWFTLFNVVGYNSNGKAAQVSDTGGSMQNIIEVAVAGIAPGGQLTNSVPNYVCNGEGTLWIEASGGGGAQRGVVKLNSQLGNGAGKTIAMLDSGTSAGAPPMVGASTRVIIPPSPLQIIIFNTGAGAVNLFAGVTMGP